MNLVSPSLDQRFIVTAVERGHEAVVKQLLENGDEQLDATIVSCNRKAQGDDEATV